MRKFLIAGCIGLAVIATVWTGPAVLSHFDPLVGIWVCKTWGMATEIERTWLGYRMIECDGSMFAETWMPSLSNRSISWDMEPIFSSDGDNRFWALTPDSSGEQLNLTMATGDEPAEVVAVFTRMDRATWLALLSEVEDEDPRPGTGSED